jgi:hypothetical protein
MPCIAKQTFYLAKQTFYLSKRLYSNGKDSFYSNAASTNIEDIIEIEKFVQDTNIHDFVKTIKDNYLHIILETSN